MQTADQIGRQLQSARDLHSISRIEELLDLVTGFLASEEGKEEEPQPAPGPG